MTTSSCYTESDGPDSPLTLSEVGKGRPALVLHGGGGLATVATISSHLAGSMQVITPTHPGWDGTERPGWLDGVAGLANLYLSYLEHNGLTDVFVVGSSIGGWIGAEMAVRDSGRRISGLVLIDAVGVVFEREPITDFFALDPRGIAENTFYDSEQFYVDPASLTAEQAASQRANMATTRIVAGDPYMHDPNLLGRLDDVEVPTLAIWGDSDNIVTPAYGRLYAEAFANAAFEVVRYAGHLPHIEQPEATFALIDAHAAATRGDLP